MPLAKEQNQSTRALHAANAKKGRNGDTMMGHLTPGEVVIPAEVAATQPGLVNGVMSTVLRMGGDPSKLTVGNGSINPVTGIQEFATDPTVAGAYAAAAPVSQAAYDQAASMYTTNLGRAGDQEGINYWAGQIDSGKDISDAFKGSAKTVYENYAQTGSSPYSTLLDQDFKNASKGTSPQQSLESPISEYIYGKATPAPEPASAVAQASQERWNVTPNMTVQQQAANIIDADSPLMQQARSTAMQQMNARGLVNSSMGINAGQQAVLNSAIDIGKQDANTYASAGQFNAGQSNDLSKFNAGQTNTWNTNALDRSQQTNERLGAQSYNSGEKALDRTFASGEKALDRTFNSGENLLDRNLTTTQNDANRTFTAGQSALDRTLTTTQNELNRVATSADRAAASASSSADRQASMADAAAARVFTASQNALTRAADLDRYNLDAATKKTATELGYTHNKQMQNDEVVANAYTNTVSQLASIDANTNLDEYAKVSAKNEVITQFESYATVRGLNMDLAFGEFSVADKASDKTGLVNTASGGGFTSTGGDGGGGGGASSGGAGTAGNAGSSGSAAAGTGDGGPGGVGAW